jgi:hypothetical protein
MVSRAKELAALAARAPFAFAVAAVAQSTAAAATAFTAGHF